MATKRREAHALISYYLTRYKKKYGTNPSGLNRNTLVFGFEGLVDDYPGEGRKIIDYWFDNYREHNPKRFIYEYGNVVESILEDEEDERERRKIRRLTQERMRNVANSRESNQGGSSE